MLILILHRENVGAEWKLVLSCVVAPNSGLPGTKVAQLFPALLLEDPIVPIPPELVEQAVKQNGDAYRVNLPDGRAVDLKGADHFNKATGESVPTPHVHDPQAPFEAPYDNIPRPPNPVPRPATPQDIFDVLRHLFDSQQQKVMPVNPHRFQNLMA